MTRKQYIRRVRYLTAWFVLFFVLYCSRVSFRLQNRTFFPLSGTCAWFDSSVTSLERLHWCKVTLLDDMEFAVSDSDSESGKYIHTPTRGVKYEFGFLTFREGIEYSKGNVHASLHRAASSTKFLYLVLSEEQGLVAENSRSLKETYTEHEQDTAGITLSPGSLAWWELILHGAGLHFLDAKWGTHLGRKLFMRVRVGVSHRLCGCACKRDGFHAEHLRSSTSFPFLSYVTSWRAPLQVPANHFVSCAVVFNSGLIDYVQNPWPGDMIDAHSAVFRINQGPSGGLFARQAGSKTTFRLLYPNAKTMKSFGNETLLVSIHNTSEYKLLREAVADGRIKRQQMFILPKQFRQRAKRCLRLPSRHTSTGIVAVILAMSACERVTIFGKSLVFDSLDTDKFRYHYFESNTLGSNRSNYFSPFHDPERENEFYKQLVSAGLSMVP